MESFGSIAAVLLSLPTVGPKGSVLIAWLTAVVLTLAGWALTLVMRSKTRHTLLPWVLFALAFAASAGAAFYTTIKLQPPPVRPSRASLTEPIPPRVPAARTEVGALKEQLKARTEELRKTIAELNEVKRRVESAPTQGKGPRTDPSKARTELLAKERPPKPPAPSVGPAKGARPAPQADRTIQQINKRVFETMLTGSIRPLDAVAHKELIDQFTVSPIEFSSLQANLHKRLGRGYSPSYLGSLKRRQSVIHIWKIRTVEPGPDILERLSIIDGKVAAFWFDNIN